MRYACGYVPHNLLKKYEKLKGLKEKHFVECLGNMAVVSEEDLDYLSYTKLWMEKVNRGGLFPLNYQTFKLFIEIEKMVRVVLPEHISSPSNNVSDVVNKIRDDDDVQFAWTLISQDIDSDKISSLFYT